jgi:hypothetical protein
MQAVADNFGAESKPCNNGQMCDVHTDFAIVELQTAVRAGKGPEPLHSVISEKAVTVNKCTQTSDPLAEYQDRLVGPDKRVGNSKPSRISRRKVNVHVRKPRPDKMYEPEPEGNQGDSGLNDQSHRNPAIARNAASFCASPCLPPVNSIMCTVPRLSGGQQCQPQSDHIAPLTLQVKAAAIGNTPMFPAAISPHRRGHGRRRSRPRKNEGKQSHLQNTAEQIDKGRQRCHATTLQPLSRTEKAVTGETKTTSMSMGGDVIGSWIQQKTDNEWQIAQENDDTLGVLIKLKHKYGLKRPPKAVINEHNVIIKRYCYREWKALTFIDDVLCRVKKIQKPDNPRHPSQSLGNNDMSHEPQEPNAMGVQRIVPNVWRQAIFSMMHASHPGGHRSFDRLYHMASQRFYWLKMAQDFRRFLKNCHSHAANNGRVSESNMDRDANEHIKSLEKQLRTVWTHTRQNM